MSDRVIKNPKKFKVVLPDDDPVSLHQGMRISLDRDTEFASYVTLSVEKVLVATKVADPKANAVTELRGVALSLRDLKWLADRYHEIVQEKSYTELLRENFDLRHRLGE